MMNPYFLMTLLYLFVAVLAALDASLVSFELIPWFQGLRWLRVHFITLGMVTETVFGAAPLLVAARTGKARPTTRWDIWLTLNVGLLLLLGGIPSINQPMIFMGGTLIFVAATLLSIQIWQMRKDVREGESRLQNQSLKFYITGLAYLLLGIIVGTGLWLGWSGPLRIQVPLEVHIHANNWGFLSLAFAGLLIDTMPYLSKRPIASTRTIDGIYWGMAVGALGLVIGTWLGGSLWFTVPGLVLHLTATIWLLVILGRTLAKSGQMHTAGTWHLLTSYLWILAPVMVAPLIILNVPGFPGAGIEATAPQALIYGWVLQFGYALIPLLLAHYLLGDATPRLGGNWLSLVAVNIGSVFIWASIFIEPWRGELHGVGYLFYLFSMVPIIVQLSRIARRWFKAMEQDVFVPDGDKTGRQRV